MRKSFPPGIFLLCGPARCARMKAEGGRSHGTAGFEIFSGGGTGRKHHPAAALLHLTQPTLSRQLMQLEEELGVQLFYRSRYRIVLTDDGMLLRRRAQELVDLAEKTEQEFRRDPELHGEIAIGSGELEGMHLLAEWLTSFHQLHPRVTYRLSSGNADHTKERWRTAHWIWACCWNRWISAGMIFCVCRSRSTGAYICRKIRLWRKKNP